MICLDTRSYIKNRARIGKPRVNVLINALAKSDMLDQVNIRGADRHDKVFIPRNLYEWEVWQESRLLTKKYNTIIFRRISGGKLGGRPKKVIDIKRQNDKMELESREENYGNGA